MKRIFYLFSIFFLLLFVPLLFPLHKVQAKDYYFPNVDIEVQINADGSVDVVEERTYDFDGSFSWATMWFPEKITRQGYTYQAAVTNFSVKEKGQGLPVTVSREGDLFKARWSYQAVDEKKTFVISYRLLNAVTEYTDIAEFYWQLIGGEWEKKTSYVEITITLPEQASSKEALKVFGHGPLSGQSEIVDGQSFRFTATSVPVKQYVEVRVLFPPEMVKGSPSTRHTLQTILDEEAKFVQETIAKVKRQQWVKNIVLLLLLGYLPLSILVWLILWYQVWKVKGKDYQIPDIPEHAFDLPSGLPPALVQSLLSQAGKPGPKAFTATIFDLARRGYLKIDSRAKVKSGLFGPKTSYVNRFKLTKKAGELKVFEAEVLEFLRWRVASKEEWTDFEELKKWLKKHPQIFQKWFSKWQKRVTKEARQLGFMEVAGEKANSRFWLLAILFALGIVNIPLLVLAGIMNPYLRRRTPEWQKEADLWKAVERFLDEFSNFKELPPEAYKLWESYLVFGILFGHAEKIIKMLPVILQDERAVRASWYTGVGFESGVVNAAVISNLSSSISSINTSLTPAAHYSSGSGGGFSGGGGGGGGGGGAG